MPPIRRSPLGPGQESVWDYPRPPRVEPSARWVRIIFGETIVDTHDSVRVLETSHPPVYYVRVEDVTGAELAPSSSRTFCEFKGIANYYDLRVGDRRSADAAWYYASPAAGYEPLRGRVAFYPSRVDAIYLDGERVTPQEGDFYGGWITKDVVGPFKGIPGSRGW